MKINAALEQAEHCALGAGIRGCGVSSPGGAAALRQHEVGLQLSVSKSEGRHGRSIKTRSSLRFAPHPVCLFRSIHQ